MRDRKVRNIALVAVALAGCSRPAGAPPPLSGQDLAALRHIATADSAIVMSRNWDELAAEYATDAVRMPPNAATVVGRQAIRQYLEHLPPISRFAFRLVDLQGSGEIAYLRGAWSITANPPGVAPVSDSGKILVVMRRQADGTWLRVADAWNSDVVPRP